MGRMSLRKRLLRAVLIALLTALAAKVVDSLLGTEEATASSDK